MTEHYEKWVNFLNPVVLKRRILTAGIFLCAFEMLREAVVSRLRAFYGDEWTDAKGWKENDRYKARVLSLDPKGKGDPFRASIAWLVENEVISVSEEKEFRRLTDARNEFAHEIVAVVSLGHAPDFDELFPILRAVMIKIDRWWIKNLELECDPEFLGKDIEIEEITPGRMLILDLMNNAALGNDDEAIKFYEDFVELMKAQSRS